MATYEGPFQQHFLPMVALGRVFRLGDLYNYCNDNILSDVRISWDTALLASATRMEFVVDKRLFVFNSEFAEKANYKGIDNHLKMSVIAGLVDEFRGASNFFNDRPKPGQVAFTVFICAKSREKHLDLQLLINQEVPRLLFTGVEEEGHQKSNATHIVTSVFYGIEVYCIFYQEADGGDDDEEARREILEYLSKVAEAWKDTLWKLESLNDFKKRFNKEDEHQLARINCRLYADLQVEPFIDCDVFEAYKQTLELMKTIHSEEVEKAVPISIQLFPLKFLVMETSDSDEMKFHYRDVNDDFLISRASNVMDNWKRIAEMAEDICMTNQVSTDCSPLPEFASCILRYQVFQKKIWKDSVVKARQWRVHENALFRNISNAEKHPIFKCSQLEQWLNFKLAEFDMMDSMARRAGRGIILADKKQLETRLESATSKQYVSVLFVPPLDECTSTILTKMKKYVDKQTNQIFTSEHSSEEEVEEEEIDIVPTVQQPWHMIQRKRKQVLNKVLELANHVEKNEQISNQVEFIVSFSESSKKFGCSYSVYGDGKLLKSNIRRLPDPPTGLRIHHPVVHEAKRPKTSSSCICVEWNYIDLGFPCQFLVEYRLKDSSDPWSQQKTTKPGQTQLSITFTTGSTLEIRVAAESCIGRSDFSDVIDTDSNDEVDSIMKKEEIPLLPPSDIKVTTITATTAELTWTTPTGNLRPNFPIFFLANGVVCSTKVLSDPCKTIYRLEHLEPDTTYSVKIAITACEVPKDRSETSEPVEFTTSKNIRFAEKLLESSKKIGNENGLDMCAVPLTKLNGRLKTGERFMLGKPDVNKTKEHRTILLVGAANSGKTSLINNMVNYVFGVDREDPFRFQLIDPSGVNFQKRVAVYDIFQADEIRLPFPCTIIDTPNYIEDGPVENQEITELLRKFFDDKDGGIQEVDMVCFVMDSSIPQLMPLQLYIYCSLITIFGNKIKENLDFLFTSVDQENFPLWSSILDAGLISHGPFFPSNQNHIKFLFNQEPGNFRTFFSSLQTKRTKFVSLSKQLLDEKNRLETTVNGLYERLKKDMAKFEEMRKMIDKYGKRDKFELEVTRSCEVILPFGVYVTNCTKCKMTCHIKCGIKESKLYCDVMDHSMPEEIRTCRVCPGKCSWDEHGNDTTRFDYRQEKDSISLETLKNKYETTLKQTLTWPNFENILKTESRSQDTLVEQVETILVLIERLCKIAWRIDPHSTSGHCLKVSEYVDDAIGELIRAEKKEKSFGFDVKIERLDKVHQMAYLNERGLLGCSGEERYESILKRWVPEHLEREASISSSDSSSVSSSDSSSGSSSDSSSGSSSD